VAFLSTGKKGEVVAAQKKKERRIRMEGKKRKIQPPLIFLQKKGKRKGESPRRFAPQEKGPGEKEHP